MKYEIIDVISKHPTLGDLNKKVIHYYNDKGELKLIENWENSNIEYKVRDEFTLKEAAPKPLKK